MTTNSGQPEPATGLTRLGTLRDQLGITILTANRSDPFGPLMQAFVTELDAYLITSNSKWREPESITERSAMHLAIKVVENLSLAPAGRTLNLAELDQHRLGVAVEQHTGDQIGDLDSYIGLASYAFWTVIGRAWTLIRQQEVEVVVINEHDLANTMLQLMGISDVRPRHREFDDHCHNQEAVIYAVMTGFDRLSEMVVR